MVLGEKLFEGKGKSGAGFIKSVGIEGVKRAALSRYYVLKNVGETALSVLPMF